MGNNLQSNSIYRSNHWFEVATILYLLLRPVLTIYGGMNWGYDSILLLGLMFFYVIDIIQKKKNPLKCLPKILVVYFIWLIICNYLSAGSLIPFGNIYMLLTFCLVFSVVDMKLLLKYYRWIAIAAIVLFFFQEFSYATTGYRISGIIEWLPFRLGGESVDAGKFVTMKEEMTRSSSFFSEPAHFAQFLLPLFAIELFKIHNFRSAIFPGIMIVVLLFLQSGNALVGLACVGVVFILKLLNIKSLIKKIVLFIVIGGCAIIGGTYYIQSTMGEKLLERQETITGDAEYSSGFLRVYRGYYVYDEYSFIEKIIGINNYDKIKQKRDQSEVSFLFLDDDDFYFNCFQDFLLRTGIIGGIMFFILCYSLWKNNSFPGKAIIFTFFVLSFTASLYMSTTMILYLYLSYKLQKQKKTDQNLLNS